MKTENQKNMEFLFWTLYNYAWDYIIFDIDSKLIHLLSGVPDYFGRNKISSGGDLSHYSSASLY